MTKKKANLYNPANVTIKDLLDLMVTLAGGPMEDDRTLKEQDAMAEISGMLIRSGYPILLDSLLSYFDADSFDEIEQHAQIWLVDLFGRVLWAYDKKS
jgi:hypothetical protein